jgi:hypothetical protein
MAMNNELGWFGSKAVRKVRKGARKIYKPIAAVERVVRPIGKKIPVVGYFAQLHEDITEPMERRVLGLKGKAKKTKAEKMATMVISSGAAVAGGLKARGLPSGPDAVKAIQSKAAGQLRSLAATGNKNAVAMFDLAVKAKALRGGARGPVAGALRRAASSGKLVTPKGLAAAAARVGATVPKMSPKSGVYLVVTPDGRRVEVPAAKVR